jgi:hypothetical protein
MKMKKPHKHAELIKAWADGAEIDCSYDGINWEPILGTPSWLESCQYRIKPEPKPDVVEHMSIYRNLNRRYENERPVGERIDCQYVGNVLLTWDGETRKLKSAEVL